MASRLVAVPGQMFHRLTVLNEAGARLTCRCACGTVKTYWRSKVVSGHTKSCGCLNDEVRQARAMEAETARHADPAKEALRRTYKGMRSRCSNPSDRNYGGRGIRVCDEWKGVGGFDRFAEYMAGLGPKPPGTTIDRWPDNNGDYRPGNVRWATPKQQARNMRVNRIVAHGGQSAPLSAHIEESGLPSKAVGSRIYSLGWSIKDALTTPTRRKAARRPLVIFGRRWMYREAAAAFDINQDTLSFRIGNGWSPRDACLVPAGLGADELRATLGWLRAGG